MNEVTIERVKEILTQAARRIEKDGLHGFEARIAFSECVRAVTEIYSLTIDELTSAGLEISINGERVL